MTLREWLDMQLRLGIEDRVLLKTGQIFSKKASEVLKSPHALLDLPIEQMRHPINQSGDPFEPPYPVSLLFIRFGSGRFGTPVVRIKLRGAVDPTTLSIMLKTVQR